MMKVSILTALTLVSPTIAVPLPDPEAESKAEVLQNWQDYSSDNGAWFCCLFIDDVGPEYLIL
jgi:hypothetical protein